VTTFRIYNIDEHAHAAAHPEEYEGGADEPFAEGPTLDDALNSLVEGHIQMIMDSAKHLAQAEVEETLEGAPKHDFESGPYSDVEYIIVREEP
jgi:hypothetical protein